MAHVVDTINGCVNVERVGQYVVNCMRQFGGGPSSGVGLVDNDTGEEL